MLTATWPVSAKNTEDAIETRDAPADPLKATFMAARGGDRRALDELVRALRPRLFAVALSVLRDRDLADDIAQDALLRALDRRFLFLATGTVAAWTSRIALNLAKNRARDERRRREIVHGAESARAERTHGAGPVAADALLVDDEERRALRAAIDALPERQRDVVTLRVVGGLTFREIAGLLAIREENARVTASQALARIRARLVESGHARALARAGGSDE